MIKAFFWSRKWALWAYGGGILIILFVLSGVYLEILWNDWIKTFYDILGNPKEHTLVEFYWQLLVFAGLAGGFIGLGTISRFITQHYTFRWRDAMNEHYTSLWCKIPEKIEGEAQRLQEDAMRFGVFVEDFAEQILNIVIILPFFLRRLYEAGATIDLSWIGKKYIFLAWLFEGQSALIKIALITCIAGSIFIAWCGRRLPRLQYQNQVVEAKYRRGLELAVDNKPRLGLYEELAGLFVGLRLNYYRLYWEVGKFSFWRISFSQIMIILPYILVAPSIFGGITTLGTMQQTINIFDTVRSKFSFFIDNWRSFTEFLSIRLRLKEFEANLDKYQISPRDDLTK